MRATIEERLATLCTEHDQGVAALEEIEGTIVQLGEAATALRRRLDMVAGGISELEALRDVLSSGPEIEISCSVAGNPHTVAEQIRDELPKLGCENGGGLLAGCG